VRPGTSSSQVAAWLWASPNTLMGWVLGLVVLGFGGRVQFVSGVAEFHGGALSRLVTSPPWRMRFSAITLGHVILGVSAEALARLRAHEHVHVRQYERWGPFFLPAYVLSSAWQLANGRSMYLGNHFERQAFAQDAENAPET
jgi:hypothetical protein